MMPIGRQCASGIVLAVVGHSLLDELRGPRLIRCLALGVLPPTLPKPAPPPPRRPRAGGGRPGSRVISQTPDKSGLPSDVRGVAALMSTLPSGPSATPAGTNVGHCAATAVDAMTTNARTIGFFISRSFWYVFRNGGPTRLYDARDDEW